MCELPVILGAGVCLGVGSESGVASERWSGWSVTLLFIQDAVKAVLKWVHSTLLFSLFVLRLGPFRSPNFQ